MARRSVALAALIRLVNLRRNETRNEVDQDRREAELPSQFYESMACIITRHEGHHHDQAPI
jgi:hypothetical protein